MAEFVEVMRQARRMCNDQMNCEDCPLCYENNGANCRFALDEKYQADAELERVVLDWAAEHPEPVYPSWEEAWKKLFPEMASVRPPCVRYFLPTGEYQDICDRFDGECYKCNELPVPAEIAKKLQIRPIEIKKPVSCRTCKYSDKSVWEAPCLACKRAHGDCYPDQREGENDAEVHLR